MQQRLLFLNPPAPVPVFRDCYCSGPAKGGLAVHPLDLQVQSGFFQDDNFRVEYIDAIQEGSGPPETLARIRAFSPNVILALVGDIVLDHDAEFLRCVKAVLPDCRIFASGDAPRFCAEDTFMRIPALEGILIDFTSPALLEHLNGHASPALVVRGQPVSDAPRAAACEYPLPRTDVITASQRRLPFFRVPEYYSILTSFGCPYGCLYCNAHCGGYRTRSIDHVIAELQYAAGLGYTSLYIRDASFCADREHARALLDAWQRSGLLFEWICFSRPDLIDEEIATSAARLGCRLVMLGVESVDDDCLRGLARPLPFETTRRAFRLLRQSRIPAAAQFIAGLRRLGPEGQLRDIRGYEADLVRSLSELDPDFVSFSTYHPRPGLPRGNPVLEALTADRAACEGLARRVTRRFYARPRRMLRHLAGIRSLAQCAQQARAAVHLLVPPRSLHPALPGSPWPPETAGSPRAFRNAKGSA